MSLVLQAREKRAQHITELMKEYKYKTIVVLKLNVPGANKNQNRLKFISNLYDSFIKREFIDKIKHKGEVKSIDGDYVYYVVEEEGNVVKEKTILIEEENSLGKLVDIDVYNKTSITREDVQCEMRKCLICNNYSHVCVRNQTHTHEELFHKIDEITEEYLFDYILNKAIKGINCELNLYPKFGLVSARDSGSHTDMNFQTFVNSIYAIKPYLKEFILYGLSDIEDPIKLKEIGIRAEKAMFNATNNINTHKGLIFIMGIFLPVMSRAIRNNYGILFIKKEIIKIGELIIGDYYDNISIKKTLSHGDKIYLNYGIKGIRGEVLNGLSLIYEIPSYKNKQIINIHHEYLTYLMSELDDTTIIHRNDIETLNEVKETMKNVVKDGGYSNNIALVENISNQYKKRNISPGGSADMLVVKIIFEELKYLLK
jgi:holo-ACP synthase CitX